MAQVAIRRVHAATARQSGAPGRCVDRAMAINLPIKAICYLHLSVRFIKTSNKDLSRNMQQQFSSPRLMVQELPPTGPATSFRTMECDLFPKRHLCGNLPRSPPIPAGMMRNIDRVTPQGFPLGSPMYQSLAGIGQPTFADSGFVPPANTVDGSPGPSFRFSPPSSRSVSPHRSPENRPEFVPEHSRPLSPHGEFSGPLSPHVVEESHLRKVLGDTAALLNFERAASEEAIRQRDEARSMLDRHESIVRQESLLIEQDSTLSVQNAKRIDAMEKSMERALAEKQSSPSPSPPVSPMYTGSCRSCEVANATVATLEKMLADAIQTHESSEKAWCKRQTEWEKQMSGLRLESEADKKLIKSLNQNQAKLESHQSKAGDHDSKWSAKLSALQAEVDAQNGIIKKLMAQIAAQEHEIADLRHPPATPAPSVPAPAPAPAPPVVATPPASPPRDRSPPRKVICTSNSVVLALMRP